MREISYRTFSRRVHDANAPGKRPNACQFELTFGCDYRCTHCYTDCYNTKAFAEKELGARRVKVLLDKMRRAGIIWVCFTGGDPLARGDFREIYSYAVRAGFLITIFTNGYRIDEGLVDLFKKNPPFAIEITLNAVTKALYEKISRKPGSFDKAMRAIELMAGAKLPLKLKTQVTRENLSEATKVRAFANELGVPHNLSPDIHGRLDGDSRPCDLRIAPAEFLKIKGRSKNRAGLKRRRVGMGHPLFRCAGGSGDGMIVDPCGRAVFCQLIRKPSFDLLRTEIGTAIDGFSSYRRRSISADSKCRNCAMIEICEICPGISLIEKGCMDAPIGYFCDLARAQAGRGRT